MEENVEGKESLDRQQKYMVRIQHGMLGERYGRDTAWENFRRKIWSGHNMEECQDKKIWSGDNIRECKEKDIVRAQHERMLGERCGQDT